MKYVDGYLRIDSNTIYTNAGLYKYKRFRSYDDNIGLYRYRKLGFHGDAYCEDCSISIDECIVDFHKIFRPICRFIDSITGSNYKLVITDYYSSSPYITFYSIRAFRKASNP